MAPPTVNDLMAARGTRPFAMLRVETLEEAEAAARAGVWSGDRFRRWNRPAPLPPRSKLCPMRSPPRLPNGPACS